MVRAKRCNCSFHNLCKEHVCKCKACKVRPGKKCSWRARGHKFVAKYSLKAKDCHGGYLGVLQDEGLNIDSRLITTPRLRANLDALSSICHARGIPDVLSSSMVADVTQSIMMTGIRLDGLAPTIATGSRLFVARWRRLLHAREAFRPMGFPEGLCFDGFSESQLFHVVGNTMHCAVVGTLMAASVSLTS